MKTRAIHCMLLLSLVLVIKSHSQSPEWLRKIVPMEAKISDVSENFKDKRKEVQDDNIRFWLPEGV